MIPNGHRTNAEESSEASSAALELELIEAHTWLFHEYLEQLGSSTPFDF